MKALLICGSRNPFGQTARAGQAVIDGLRSAGASVEQVYLPCITLEHCRQCDDQGWGKCRTEGACIAEDEFQNIAAAIRASDAAIFTTPVYWGDLSESMRAFTDKLRRICTHESGRTGIKGKPAIGICVAGGGGGGAPSCCEHLSKVLGTCGFDVVDVIPVRRQNLETKLPQLELAGKWLAGF